MKEEKSGKLGTIIYYDENRFFTIGSFESEDEMFYALGTLPHPKKGCRYRLIGEWRQHPRYGEQFSFSSFEELPPTSSEG
ncbi:MAG TPA: ATP-dependent RecD-like DNA helicase, partial [Bacillota bacterium]|nr:ATP-dependent RecD-like DNA helicase [Bacillota bacterium]